MEIKIKTLTPLWTGDVDRKCETLKETGIIGSIRWWYEALVRGLGGYACDPTDENDKCPNKEGNICDTCELFGCTGWNRKFILRINDSPSPSRLSLLSRIENPLFIHRGKRSRLSGWYQRVYGNIPKAFYGDIKFEMLNHSSFLKNEDFENISGFLLKIISLGGGLGAKNQIGYGIIQEKCDNVDLKRGYDVIKQVKGERINIKTGTPTLKDYFKFEVNFPLDFLDDKNAEWYPNKNVLNQNYRMVGFTMKFLIRNKIKSNIDIARKICSNYDDIVIQSKERRNQFRRRNNPLIKKYQPNKVIARSLFGSDMSNKKWASLIYLSDSWKFDNSYKMRIWGFIPETISFDNFNCEINNKKLTKNIRKIIKDVFVDASFSNEVLGKELIKEALK